jgi:hypothetical protein
MRGAVGGALFENDALQQRIRLRRCLVHSIQIRSNPLHGAVRANTCTSATSRNDGGFGSLLTRGGKEGARRGGVPSEGPAGGYHRRAIPLRPGGIARWALPPACRPGDHPDPPAGSHGRPDRRREGSRPPSHGGRRRVRAAGPRVRVGQVGRKSR